MELFKDKTSTTYVPDLSMIYGPLPDYYVEQLSQVIHDWADAESIAILSNIRSSMAPNGKVLIREPICASYAEDEMTC